MTPTKANTAILYPVVKVSRSSPELSSGNSNVSSATYDFSSATSCMCACGLRLISVVSSSQRSNDSACGSVFPCSLPLSAVNGTVLDSVSVSAVGLGPFPSSCQSCPWPTRGNQFLYGSANWHGYYTWAASLRVRLCSRPCNVPSSASTFSFARPVVGIEL